MEAVKIPMMVGGQVRTKVNWEVTIIVFVKYSERVSESVTHVYTHKHTYIHIYSKCGSEFGS